MKQNSRSTQRFAPALIGATAALVMTSDAAGAFDWEPFREDSTIEIVTLDEDGKRRETTIWIVVLDEAGFIRTNDSRWLANIRRDPAVQLHCRDALLPFDAKIVDDREVTDQVELAFKAKYGLMQKLMSTFRTSRPTVLRMTPRAER